MCGLAKQRPTGLQLNLMQALCHCGLWPVGVKMNIHIHAKKQTTVSWYSTRRTERVTADKGLSKGEEVNSKVSRNRKNRVKDEAFCVSGHGEGTLYLK